MCQLSLKSKKSFRKCVFLDDSLPKYPYTNFSYHNILLKENINVNRLKRLILQLFPFPPTVHAQSKQKNAF